jgi:CheY-like chemotaxis protein
VLDFPTPPLVIVLDDFRGSRIVMVRILEHSGFETRQATNLEEAVQTLEAVPEGTQCLVILPSQVAADHSETLLRHRRRPRLLMSCVRPPSCPVCPELHCAHLGCIEKPTDFRNSSVLIDKVKEMFSK